MIRELDCKGRVDIYICCENVEVSREVGKKFILTLLTLSGKFHRQASNSLIYIYIYIKIKTQSLFYFYEYIYILYISSFLVFQQVDYD